MQFRMGHFVLPVWEQTALSRHYNLMDDKFNLSVAINLLGNPSECFYCGGIIVDVQVIAVPTLPSDDVLVGFVVVPNNIPMGVVLGFFWDNDLIGDVVAHGWVIGLCYRLFTGNCQGVL